MEPHSSKLAFDFNNPSLPMHLSFGETGLHEAALALQTQGVDAKVLERDVEFCRTEAFTGEKISQPSRKVAFLQVERDSYTAEGLVHWGKFLRHAYREFKKSSNKGYVDGGEQCHLSRAGKHVLTSRQVRASPEQLRQLGQFLMEHRIPRTTPRKASEWPVLFQPARPVDVAALEDLDGLEPLVSSYVSRLGKTGHVARNLGAGLIEHLGRGRNPPPAWLVRRPLVYASDHLLLLDHRLAVEYGSPLRRACISHPGRWNDLTDEQKKLDPSFDPAKLRLGMVSGADHMLAQGLGVCDLRKEQSLAGIVQALHTGAQHATLQAATSTEQNSTRRSPRL